MVGTKDKQISDLISTIEILKARMGKIEELLDLKDNKIEELHSIVASNQNNSIIMTNFWLDMFCTFPFFLFCTFPQYQIELHCLVLNKGLAQVWFLFGTFKDDDSGHRHYSHLRSLCVGPVG